MDLSSEIPPLCVIQQVSSGQPAGPDTQQVGQSLVAAAENDHHQDYFYHLHPFDHPVSTTATIACLCIVILTVAA